MAKKVTNGSVVECYLKCHGWSSNNHPFKHYSAVYISGPMSDLPDHNRPAFWMAEMAINSLGVGTLSPAHWPANLPYEYYMRQDFRLLLEADVIFVLTGWKLSRGAKIEMEMASAMGLPIIMEGKI